MLVVMAANAKLGPRFIPGDLHAMTPNGALLAGITEMHSLIVCNASRKCRDTITRRRQTRDRIEQSVIDILLISSDMKEHFTKMHVDEERKHVLTKNHKSKKGIKIKESDHNVVMADFDCTIVKEKENEKMEFYNLKNKTCQAKFKTYTSNTNMLSSTVDDKRDIDKVFDRFIKKLEGCIATKLQEKKGQEE